MFKQQVYYCVIKDKAIHIVSDDFYKKNRQNLILIAIGTIDEINEFLCNIESTLDEGDESQ